MRQHPNKLVSIIGHVGHIEERRRAEAATPVLLPDGVYERILRQYKRRFGPKGPMAGASLQRMNEKLTAGIVGALPRWTEFLQSIQLTIASRCWSEVIADLRHRRPRAGTHDAERRRADQLMSKGREYIAVEDIVGKLDYLNVECQKCGRADSYAVERLLDEYGPDYSLITFREMLTVDCPRRIAARYDDRCGCCCPEPRQVWRGAAYG